MAGQIFLSAPKAPAPVIHLATGGAPGNITVTPRSQPAPKPAAPQGGGGGGYAYSGGGGDGGATYTPAVYAPALDTGAIYSRASANAAGNVNPYYTKLVNDFVNQQATARQQQQKQTDINIQNLKDVLQQQTDANAVTGTRATQDAATAEQQAAVATEQRQQDQGTAFDASRTKLAGEQAQSGLTGSGIGNKETAVAQNLQDTTEARQATADQAAKDATELAKSRTFEDLATSNKNATNAETKGVSQAQFDLDKFITSQSSDLSQFQGQTEIQRRNALASETSRQNHLLVQQFINGIANPAVRQAAIQAYGNI